MNTRSELDVTRLRPDDLHDLDNEQMKVVVDADLRRATNKPPRLPDAVSTALRSAAHIDKWHTALKSIIASVDGQLAMRADDYEGEQARLRRDMMATELEQDKTEASRRLVELRMESEDLSAQYLRRRASMQRFRSGVEEHLAECDSIRHAIVRQERHLRHEAELEVERLRAAIARHRRTITEEKIDASSIDEELWTTLEKAP